MPRTILFTFKISSPDMRLSAQIVNSSGNNITDLISTGFANLGNGYYSFEYTNYPENFRGSTKIASAADPSNTLHVETIDTSMIDMQTITDFAYDYGDTLTINYSDTSAKNIYALLYNAYDLNQAYNPVRKIFANYALQNQNDFQIVLTESTNKLGTYSAVIPNATSIAKVNSVNFYLIEIWEKVGTNINRIVDRNLGYLRLYWGGDASSSVEIAKTVWSYSERTLSQPNAIDVSSVGGINILPASRRNNGVITF